MEKTQIEKIKNLEVIRISNKTNISIEIIMEILEEANKIKVKK